MQHQNVTYYPTSITDDHWSIKWKDDFTIGLFSVEVQNEVCKVLLKLNPTDCRGYRLIAQLAHEDMRGTLNRLWTEREMTAVFRIGALVSQFFFKVGIFPQIFFAGNNAMEMKDNQLLIGRKEPAMMHIHILGRGDPNKAYISNIKLNTPAVGEEFNLKGEGKEEEHLKKVPWTPEQRDSFKEALLSFLDLHLKQVNDVSLVKKQ